MGPSIAFILIVASSSLVCADGRLNIRFSFTQDGYEAFSYVIILSPTLYEKAKGHLRQQKTRDY